MMVDKAIKTKKIRKCGINKKDMWNSFEEGSKVKTIQSSVYIAIRDSASFATVEKPSHCYGGRFQTSINQMWNLYKDILITPQREILRSRR